MGRTDDVRRSETQQWVFLGLAGDRFGAPPAFSLFSLRFSPPRNQSVTFWEGQETRKSLGRARLIPCVDTGQVGQWYLFEWGVNLQVGWTWGSPGYTDGSARRCNLLVRGAACL
jgi:hypothetical protein